MATNNEEPLENILASEETSYPSNLDQLHNAILEASSNVTDYNPEQIQEIFENYSRELPSEAIVPFILTRLGGNPDYQQKSYDPELGTSENFLELD